ncbi:histidine--tRNA ligase [Candidatus Woesebacteria bacterium]|nr:histidine--tRNA ligase [Candidatus Woesebacteria bacterium]QQG47297.1 MAG: histidine--tRNA ligase [Candidatus Woesebacteria bacterium]
MKKGPLTPKGFRDINPPIAKKRREIINKIADTLENLGFNPLETPTIEFSETLEGKYGDEEKLIYKFTDRGDRKLALRYDLTVPLARYVANNNPQFPFRRYQIGQVFRGENPQKGRFREFTQFDFDTVGVVDINEDAKIIAAAIKSIKELGFKNAKMAINDRENFKSLKVEDIREIDKIYKIGKENTRKELLEFVEKSKPTNRLTQIFEILKSEYGLSYQDFFFDPTLARGLDYYTSTILELKPDGKPEEQSIGGGGRYDKLIGMFAGREIPAVGFSFGIDRLTELV